MEALCELIQNTLTEFFSCSDLLKTTIGCTNGMELSTYMVKKSHQKTKKLVSWINLPSVPPENFTRDGIYNLIVFTAPLDSSKFFWIVCILLLLLGKLNIIQRYKIQPEDHVPWRKLPKVVHLKFYALI